MRGSRRFTRATVRPRGGFSAKGSFSRNGNRSHSIFPALSTLAKDWNSRRFRRQLGLCRALFKYFPEAPREYSCHSCTQGVTTLVVKVSPRVATCALVFAFLVQTSCSKNKAVDEAKVTSLT